jgi:hypothetical protein
MKDTRVLETRKVKDHVFRQREGDKGRTFWTIEYEISEEIPPQVTEQRRQDDYQRAMALHRCSQGCNRVRQDTVCEDNWI